MGRYKIVDDNGIYFTTHTIVDWLPVFKERKYFEIVTSSLNHCQEKKGLAIFGYVIMLTHFHLVAQTEDGDATLKYWFPEKKRIRLQPANSKMKPIYVKDAKVLGVVSGMVRRA